MSGQDQRWLTECEAKVWRSFLEMGWALDRGLDRQLTQASGLSITDYQLLVPLSESTGRQMRARDLGREVGWERSRLSHQIRRMEARGLIERRDCPTDARGTIIILTASGADAIVNAAPSHVAWVRAHFIDLLSSQELETLRKIAERVLASVSSCGAGDPCD
ncbi:MAG: MarR family winged helix-turn-helix transcriptional regulator [Acidimicrobiales bacterium]